MTGLFIKINLIKLTETNVTGIVNMNIKILLLGSIFICLTSASFADVMKWVDENGKTHYGDKVPTRYQPQAKAIDTKNSNFIENENLEANNEEFEKLRAEENEKNRVRKLKAEEDQKKQRERQRETQNNSYRDRCSGMPNQAMEIRCRKGEF